MRLGGGAGVVGLDARPKPQQPRGWRGHTAGEPRIAGERWWPTSSATRRLRAERPRLGFDAAHNEVVVLVSTRPMHQTFHAGGSDPSALSVRTPRAWFPRQPSRHRAKGVPIRPASPLSDGPPLTLPNLTKIRRRSIQSPPRRSLRWTREGDRKRAWLAAPPRRLDGASLRRRWTYRGCSPCPHPRDRSVRLSIRTEDQIVVVAWDCLDAHEGRGLKGSRFPCLLLAPTLLARQRRAALAARFSLARRGFCSPVLG